MSFTTKVKEWKKRIVHLSVAVLLLNSLYCVPVMAQVDAAEMENVLEESEAERYLAEESLVEEHVREALVVDEVSADEVIIEESMQINYAAPAEGVTVSEIRVVNVKNDTFYYELQRISSWDFSAEMEVVLSDGSIDRGSADEMCQKYFIICYGMTDMQGNGIVYDENGRIPIGTYKRKYYLNGHADICDEVILTMASLNDTTELKSGETLTGLSGCENYADSDCKNSHWFKCELEEGVYWLKRSAPGAIHFYNPSIDDDIWNYRPESYGELYIRVPEEKVGTWYFGVKGSEEFDITLYSLNDLAEEVEIGESVTGLSASENAGTKFFCDGHLFKVKIEEPGRYLVTKTSMGMVELESPFVDGPNLGYDGTRLEFEAEKAGTYYISVKGYETFDFTIERYPYVTAIEVEQKNDTIFYELVEFGTPSLFNLVSSTTVSYDDGTSEMVSPLDYGKYWSSFECYITSEDGEEPLLDEKRRLYPGNYKYILYKADDEMECEIPFKVVSVDDESAEVPMLPSGSFKLSEAMSQQGYKLVVDKPSVYKMTVSKDTSVWCIARFCSEDSFTQIAGAGFDTAGEYHLFNYWTDSYSIEPGTYYVVFQQGEVPDDIEVQIEPYPHFTNLAYMGGEVVWKYGEWGFLAEDDLNGYIDTSALTANCAWSECVNPYINMPITLTGTLEDGSSIEIPFWERTYYTLNPIMIQNIDGSEAYTDKNGYLAEGKYLLKVSSEDGDVNAEIPFEVYKDAEDIAEDQLSAVVDEMLEEAEKLADESLTNATEDEKKAVVEEVLQNVEDIYEQQDNAVISESSAKKAIELAGKLGDVEKQIEELLNTSVTVVPQDVAAEEKEIQVKNTLLSVPAGESAQIKVTTAEIPGNIPVNRESAIAIQLELVSESGEKLQLSVPVVVTIKVPEGIDTNEEIWVYHFADLQEKAKEIIKAKLNGDGTLSFVTGSFSTFVIANAAKGASVSGVVVSFGDEAEEVTIKVLNGDKVLVAETVSTAETGAYQFEQLEAGEYTLVFSKSNHVEREYSITVAEENVVLDAEIYLLGDVDGNGKVNARDKKTIYNHIAGESELTGYEFQVGDTDGNGKINARDKKMIYNHIAGEDLLW